MEIAKILANLDDGGKITVGLPQHRMTVGESVPVIVEIICGETAWDIHDLRLELAVPYHVEDGYETATILCEQLLTDVTVDTPLKKTRTASIEVPDTCPETLGGVDVRTCVKIETARASVVRESHLDVGVPTMEAAFQQVIEHGLTPTAVECVATEMEEAIPYIQRVTFDAVDEPANRKLDVLELYYRPVEGGTELSARMGRNQSAPAAGDNGYLGHMEVNRKDESAARQWAADLLP